MRPTIPAGFIEVSQAAFFDAIGPQDISPAISSTDKGVTLWRTRQGYLRGWSFDGFRSPQYQADGCPKFYALRAN